MQVLKFEKNFIFNRTYTNEVKIMYGKNCNNQILSKIRSRSVNCNILQILTKSAAALFSRDEQNPAVKCELSSFKQ